MDPARQFSYGPPPERPKSGDDNNDQFRQHHLQPNRLHQPLPTAFQPQPQAPQAPLQPSQQHHRPFYQQYPYYTAHQPSSSSDTQSSARTSMSHMSPPYSVPSGLSQGPPPVSSMPAPPSQQTMPYSMAQHDIFSPYHLQDQPPLPIETPPARSGALHHKIRASEPTQEEFVEHLKSLTHKAAGVPLLQLAHKIKMLETSNPNIESDPIFKTLNNAKDIKQERHHQLFGMAWVQSMCEASPTAVVPRNRVYARYVSSCANNNLNPLTPASFGKIIRILHPNLKTRRLGMRGKSKYHYCGIKLLDDQSSDNSASSDSSPAGSESPHSLNPQTPTYSNSPSVSGGGTPIDSGVVREAFVTTNFKYFPNLFTIIDQSMGPDWMVQPFTLPSIHDYLPKDSDVDYDVAETLHSLYRVHCMSIFETVRYMQVEKLLSLFAPFCAILTTPVFRLFTSESTLQWVKASDLAMYRAILKMLTRLQLESVPGEILTPLREILKSFVNKLSSALSVKFPDHFVQMKVTTARQFISMVRRFVRCVEYGSAASRVLCSQTERTLMLNDWLRVDTYGIILREVPCASEHSQLFDELFNDRIIKLFEKESSQANDLKASGLAPYAAFLLELPSKFPNTSPWLFSLVCSNLLTTCLREMSLAGGQSFGSWWVFRCWADEYVSWFFELGGYLADELQAEPESKIEEEMPQSDFGSANSSWAFEPVTTESARSSSYVDLLDRPNGENKSYSESEWF
ncbi:uncharacterized protein CXQ87_002672 [Candidozyma duobushaemuli]|uniref:RFX-type winged-helix domain-containing protein n=1 Tax=Candidozyma duobushaemuli TaxID=1231522 RepID=A0A2V1ACG8_9ASCO|nr:uncharacterized protein CXQ87_002672 [[Candida] duobushaemulonis]PVH14531.1 hypothetical protein CXQ87_002672 [[Candida] duobushaemulonis]